MLSETLRTIRVRLLLDNSEKLLKPNMWLSLKGDITGKEKILLIPSQALIRTENKTRVVMALNNKGEGGLLDKKFKSVEVTTGRFFNDQVEILSGLKAGDNVVTSAQFLIDSESNIDSDLQRLEASDAGSPEVDHSAMDHSTMDHSKMDHSKMDHSKMDHSNMNHAEPKGEHHDH
jgi:Cu(I)/Ag(I) efflux system membrane fusion protein